MEAVLVTSLISALGVVAVISYFSRGESYYLHHAVEDMASHLNRARAMAVSEFRYVDVEFDAANGVMNVTGNRYENDGSLQSTVTETHPIAENPAVSYVTPSNTGTFTPQGTFTSADNFWKVDFYVNGVAHGYVYVFPSGQVVRSDENIPVDEK